MIEPARDGTRRCVKCTGTLAADNTSPMCSRCLREQHDQLATPPDYESHFFDTDEFRSAQEQRHIGKVFRAYRHHPHHLHLWGMPLNQELLGRWLGITQTQVGRLENGKPEENIATLRNYAKILHLPQHILWFDLPGQQPRP